MTRARGAAVAAAVALCVYLPSLRGGFLYDDVRVVVGNEALRPGATVWDVLRIEPARPLLSLTWALNHLCAGLTPWPYHLVNVLVHAGNAALVFVLFAWIAARTGQPLEAAVVGACLFAATPMAAETVAYVASRSTALASLFALASLCLALPLLESYSVKRLAAAVGAFLLALATKEEAASVPLFLLLLDFFFVAERKPREVARRWRVHGTFFGILAAGLLARRVLTGTWLPPPAVARGSYLATQIAVFPVYLLRVLLPFDPAFYRGHPIAQWPPELWTELGWLAAAGLAALVAIRRYPELSFAILWLVVGLLPSSSLVALKEMVVDHRAYLGAAGVLFLLGSALWRPRRVLVPVAVVAVFAVFAIRYERVLADPVRAWQDAVTRAPHSAEAHRALSEAYLAAADDRAESALKRAAELEPGDARNWTNLGALYAERHRYPAAEVAMRRAADAAPSDARIRDNLAMILQVQGRTDEAIAEFEKAVAGVPALAQPRLSLAQLLLDRGEVARARALLDEVEHMPLDAADGDRYDALRARLRTGTS
jgi:tetratricopeptide (TPR) repeat protein